MSPAKFLVLAWISGCSNYAVEHEFGVESRHNQASRSQASCNAKHEIFIRRGYFQPGCIESLVLKMQTSERCTPELLNNILPQAMTMVREAQASHALRGVSGFTPTRPRFDLLDANNSPVGPQQAEDLFYILIAFGASTAIPQEECLRHDMTLRDNDPDSLFIDVGYSPLWGPLRPNLIAIRDYFSSKGCLKE